MTRTSEYIYQGPNPKDEFWRHIRLLAEPDRTICDEYIDPSDGGLEDGFALLDPHVTENLLIKPCPWCERAIESMVYDQAREDVARELDVDISEVF